MTMIKMTTIAMALSVLPTAFAQTTTLEDSVPYTITFDGKQYPAGLDEMEYPYTAARLGVSGECTLNIHADEAGRIAAMSIAQCSDQRFAWASRRFIERQDFEGSATSDLISQKLTVTWSMQPEEPTIFAENIR